MSFFSFIFSVACALGTGYCVGRAHASFLRFKAEEQAKEAQKGSSSESDDEDDDGDDFADEDDDVDVCLRVGMPVVCRLSGTSHTHGVLLGFAMGTSKDDPMLAIVDVGRRVPPMAIDVDRVEPHTARSPEAGYRESADPNKQWN